MTPAPKFQPSHLDQRREMWLVFSELFLDTELDESLYLHIAQFCKESPFTWEECEIIFWQEVYPVCIGNMLTPAGLWSGFDKEWLCTTIEKRITFWQRLPWKWLRWRWRLFDGMVKDDWDAVERYFGKIR